MNPNDPAFPVTDVPNLRIGAPGMSLLEHFSIQLLPTAISLHAQYGEAFGDVNLANEKYTPESACKLAVLCAKALISELNKENAKLEYKVVKCS